MANRRPMLMVNFSRQADVYCSICGEGFPLHGSAQYLIDAFTFHVRKEHTQADAAARITGKAAEKD